jgi:hypothetical protein
MKDQDRPLVAAHLSFQNERESFKDLDLRQRFEKIHQTNLWQAETSRSGPGSEDDATAKIQKELPSLLKNLGVSSLLDAPCGDASWIMKCNLGVEYTGLDIVPDLIDALQQKSLAGLINGQFALADLTVDHLPRADAILCRDCLVHFCFDRIEKAMHNFKRSGARFLITTTFSEWNTNHDIEDGDWRALNFQRPPFNWPEPVALLYEGCTEVNGAYNDKCLGVWNLSDC